MNLLFQSLSGPGALPPLSVPGPSAVSVLCVGPRRSLCSPRRSLCWGPPSMSGPDALCVGPGALCLGPGALCVGPPALSVSGPSAALCVGPFCVGPRRSLAVHLGPQRSPFCFWPQRSLCRGPSAALSVSGPGALCVAARRSLCPGPALSVALCRAPHSLCRGPALSVSGPGALSLSMLSVSRSVSGSVSGPGTPAALCVGPRRLSLSVSGPNTCSRFVLGPTPACSSDPRVRGPQLKSACHPSGPQSVRGGPPAQIRVPPIRPGAFPFSRREPQTLLFGG